MCYNGRFCTSRIPEIDFTENLSGRKIMKFLRCVTENYEISTPRALY